VLGSCLPVYRQRKKLEQVKCSIPLSWLCDTYSEDGKICYCGFKCEVYSQGSTAMRRQYLYSTFEYKNQTITLLPCGYMQNLLIRVTPYQMYTVRVANQVLGSTLKCYPVGAVSQLISAHISALQEWKSNRPQGNNVVFCIIAKSESPDRIPQTSSLFCA